MGQGGLVHGELDGVLIDTGICTLLATYVKDNLMIATLTALGSDLR